MQSKRYILLMIIVLAVSPLSAQTIYESRRDDATILFFDPDTKQYIPHITRMYQNGRYLHGDIWWRQGEKQGIEPPMMMITDWEDDGNGGVSAIPRNSIMIGMAPLNQSYFISPSIERYHHLFCHEYTHTIMTDKTARRDRMWRSFTGGKFTVDNSHPFSAIWSYLGTPRWYSPRWYHEGIACFMETWMGGGVGRALGGYDEMYFRSLINENSKLYSVVGLETEGSVSDFQLGTNSYLYGTRFVNYLVYRYGVEKLLSFYNRTEDSKVLFSKQFHKVYGQPLRKVWSEWQDFERQHQSEQLQQVSQYPITTTETLTQKTLGSVSPPLYDEHRHMMYYAANYPGDFAHIEQLDLSTGKQKNLHTIDGPMLYQTAYVALDTLRQRLIYTTQNGQARGLQVLDIASGSITKKMPLQRVSNIVYDNTNDCLYGIMSSGGICYLISYDKDLDDRTILYPFNFGLSVFDLDVSHDGRYLSATISEKDGQQTIIRFSVNDLKNSKLSYERIYTLDDSNLGQFRFAPGDSVMVGSSYYTGVSNLWQLNLKTKKFDLLTNTDIGMFAPLQYSNDSLFALRFERDGMRPVRLKHNILHDANAITLLGQRAYENNKTALEKLGEHITPVPKIAYNEVYDSIRVYHPFSRLRFNGAFPEVSGFRDKESWNNVTPVLGYRIMFSDPLGLHTLRLSLGMSPWSHNSRKNQYHAELDWKFWNWKLNAAWNHTNFYDLFGPLQSSRKGWQVTGGYDYSSSMLAPYNSGWGFLIGAYGDMDALPLFQNVEVENGIRSFQTASVYWNASKTYRTLGAIMPEKGWTFNVDASTYLADGRFFPALDISASRGWLLPWRNTSLWLRGYAGQSFGDQTSSFGNNYFGGFRNNYVDRKPVMQYREANAMAGADIDEIKAHNYGKLMAEVNFRPFHFNNVGFAQLYPTQAYLSAFSSVLVTNPYHLSIYHDGEGLGNCKTYTNIGSQLNFEVVMFSYLKTTWSVGYARIFMPDRTNKGQWMLSLKLL